MFPILNNDLKYNYEEGILATSWRIYGMKVIKTLHHVVLRDIVRSG